MTHRPNNRIVAVAARIGAVVALILGAESYHDLFLKASDAGTPAHIGNTIRERARRMDDICNPD